MGFRTWNFSVLILLPVLCVAQDVVLPAGTPLPVKIDEHLPMRVGQVIRAQLMYPVYANNVLALPTGTIVTGSVESLQPNGSRRVSARLRGNFTPFRIAIVRFNSVILSDGRTISIPTGTATDGAPIYRLVAPPPRKGGFVRQQWDNGVQIFRDRLKIITGPNKNDRLVQFLYTQLPYHPQRIENGTAWTVETSEPVAFALKPAVAGEIASFSPADPVDPAKAGRDEFKTRILQAYLQEPVSSAQSKPGQTIHATVAEPIYDADHTVAIPQGATLTGVVTQAKAARRFGRAGVLHFDFRQLELPGGTQSVQSSLTGVDSAAGQNLALDSEGQVKPKPQDKLLVPFVLLALAARPLDRDGHHQFAKDGAASNSIGLVGLLVGTAAKQPNLAAGLGYYGAAISLYERWIKRGRDVSFAKDTRLVLQTTPRRSTVLRPDASTTRSR